MNINIILFTNNDVTKKGKFKKRNKAKRVTIDGFIKWLDDNEYTITKNYYDSVGYVLDTPYKFIANYDNGLVAGISTVISYYKKNE